LRDFHDLYRPLASSWQLYDNGEEDGPMLVAEQIPGGPVVILDPVAWSGLEAKSGLCHQWPYHPQTVGA